MEFVEKIVKVYKLQVAPFNNHIYVQMVNVQNINMNV